MSPAAQPACLRVAMFPRGLDGLFLPELPGSELLALVERGAPEEKWLRQLLPASQVLPYTLDRTGLGMYATTYELLTHSDIDEVLQRSGASGLLLSCSCSAEIAAWARRRKIRLLLPEYAHQRLEDKLWFDAFLRRYHLPRPRGGAYTVGGRVKLPVAGRAVLQIPDSMGGEGTFFIDGLAEVATLVEKGLLRKGQRSLVRKYIEGRAYGITVFVAPSVIALSPLRMQCYHPAPEAAAAQCFAGIQWVAAHQLPASLLRRIDGVFRCLGVLLYQRRFFGVANCDFMVDGQDRVYVIECNPRMSAATPQLLGRPELCPDANLGELLMRGLMSPRRYPRAYQCLPLPATEYQGATLELVHHAPASSTAIVTRTFPSGLYGFQGDQIQYRGPDLKGLAVGDGFGLCSYAWPGQKCHGEEPFGSIVSNQPLYDQQGALLPRARRLLEHFRYTDDRQGS